MAKNCKYCNKPVILVPSAAERAKKWGQTAAYYENLFDYHTECFLKVRDGQPMNNSLHS